jgi:molybdopterin/thiamine biosynthesis adenylyltransferase
LRQWRTFRLQYRGRLPRRRSTLSQLSTFPWIATDRCRYDRQLRLWGATGQIALENSHILLINSGPGVVGVETLKNLVLPCIGNFTIQDTAIIGEADLGVNFFLEDEHLGDYRARQTCNLLKELNPDVDGHYITEVCTVIGSEDFH